ncbi:MAG: type I methionyl aminopeptidase [Frankiaceae bacterium]|nr:type I methionyl aminopeptidase [Frankiaceae bacterium]
MIALKTPGEIDAMAASGAVVAEILASCRAAATVGTSLKELDDVAMDVLARNGATSPFLNYQPRSAPIPFPAAICTSVNDAVLHGIPTSYRIVGGDLVSVDCGATIDGWVADAAVSFVVGEADPADLALVDATQDALAAAIDAAVAGNRIGDLSAAIGAVCRSRGYGLNTDYGGHGVGNSMHEAPSVPNEGRPGRGLKLQPGLVLAIEPWFMAGGSDDYRIDADGWTIRSADGSRTSHSEHSVAITDSGPRVLTR